MWTRLELKERAKAALKANYFMVVIVSLLFTLLVSGGNASSNNQNQNNNSPGIVNNLGDEINFTNPTIIPEVQQNVPVRIQVGSFLWNFVLGLAMAAGGVVLIAAGIVAMLVHIFVINPFEVGIRKFFMDNTHGAGRLETLGYAFKSPYYTNIVKAKFFETLYIALWTLCLVIPGVIKGYEYRMVSYILAEHPEMDWQNVLAESQRMMDGEKMDTFVLDLSFFPWALVSAITLNIAGILFVTPYQLCTQAELYEVLRRKEFVEEPVF